jgi:hypothetical protein
LIKSFDSKGFLAMHCQLPVCKKIILVNFNPGNHKLVLPSLEPDLTPFRDFDLTFDIFNIAGFPG